MTLLGSAQHQRLVYLAKAGRLIFCLLEPRLKLLLSHLQVLDMGGGRSKRETLLDFWLETGRASLRRR
jgi:hypothetical protein